MGLFDGLKKLQEMAEQAKSVVEQVKNMAGTSETEVAPADYTPSPTTADLEQPQSVPDVSGLMVIESADGNMVGFCF